MISFQLHQIQIIISMIVTLNCLIAVKNHLNEYLASSTCSSKDIASKDLSPRCIFAKYRLLTVSTLSS